MNATVDNWILYCRRRSPAVHPFRAGPEVLAEHYRETYLKTGEFGTSVSAFCFTLERFFEGR